MEGKQRPLAKTGEEDTRVWVLGEPWPGPAPTWEEKGRAPSTGRKGAPMTTLSRLGWGGVPGSSWRSGRRELGTPPPLPTHLGPQNHLVHVGQALGTMSPPSRKLLHSQELLMARLGSSPFSGYLCQAALSSGAKLCTDFSCVFPFSSPSWCFHN